MELARLRPGARLEQRSRASARRAEELPQAFEELFGPHLHGVGLVGHARELVALVGHDVLEGRVVGGPAQQQIVVGHHQLRAAQRRAAPTEGAAALGRALLARTVLGARGHGAAAQVAQRREAPQEAPRQGAHLAVGPQLRTAGQRREGEPVARIEARRVALGQHLLRAAPAQVVGAALDRERAQLGMAEHRRSGGDVLAEELVLQHLGARRDHDGIAHAPGRALGGEGDGRREVGETLAHAGAALEQEAPPLVEQPHELAGQRDLLPAHPVAREPAPAALGVGQGGRDGVGVEGHAQLAAARNGDVLRLGIGARLRCQRRRAEQVGPGLAGGEAVQRRPGHDEAPLPFERAAGDACQHAGRVEGVGERAVALLASEQQRGEGLETQVGGVGIGQGQQVLGVEVGGATERGRDEARQEVALEIGVVGDQGAAVEGREDARRHLRHARRVGEVGVAQPGEGRDRARHSPGRAEARLGHPHATGIEQYAAQLDGLGARALARKARGLEVDDGQRAARGEEGRQRLEVETEPGRIGLPRLPAPRRRFRQSTRGPGG